MTAEAHGYPDMHLLARARVQNRDAMPPKFDFRRRPARLVP